MSCSSDSRWPPGCTLLALSGGGSRRLGRDKATTHVGGLPLLLRLIAAVPEDVPVVLIGPAVPGLPARVRVTREEPPGGGPLAGIGAGLSLVATRTVAVLAVDMPFGVPVVTGALAELDAADASVDAVLPTDEGGQPQPLCAAYRADALRVALGEIEPLAGRPVRALLAQLHVMEWPVPTAALVDVDTAEELAAARARAAVEGAPMQAWIAAVQEALGLDVVVEVDTILDVARDAAHAVSRPTAPVTTFLLGVAVASGADPTGAAATIGRLAQDWPAATV